MTYTSPADVSMNLQKSENEVCIIGFGKFLIDSPAAIKTPLSQSSFPDSITPLTYDEIPILSSIPFKTDKGFTTSRYIALPIELHFTSPKS